MSTSIQDTIDEATGAFATWLTGVNDAVYLWVVIITLVATGLYLTVVTRGVQVRHFRSMLRHLASSRTGASGGISSFQAFAIGMATRIGIGNITGVALAMILGGPGSLLWMWLVALIGMATAFAEATLAQIFKQKHGDGTFRGGPATYILYGMKSRAFAVTFAVCMIFSMAVAMPMVQSNTIAGVFQHSHNVPTWASAVILAVLTALILIGGVRWVARATEVIAPIMALAYIATAFIVVAMNITEVPAFFATVVESAFTPKQAAVGTSAGILAALLNGVRRGLFSNEAGMGTNPNAAATATVAHPVQQGLIQSFGVFIDTMVVCSATGFIIFTTGALTPGLIADDADHLTTTAIQGAMGGWMALPISLMIFFFGFSSTIGAFAYAEANIVFLKLGRPWELATRASFVVFSAVGSLLALRAVWAIMDTAMAVVTVLNLIAIIALTRWVTGALADFESQDNPAFSPDSRFLPSRVPTNGWDR